MAHALLLHRKLAGFSVDRLMHFLVQLGQDIDIVIKSKPRNRKNARVNVVSPAGSSRASKGPIAAKSLKSVGSTRGSKTGR